MKNRIYSAEHPSYIKLSAILDEHGLMSEKEDEMIQDILNILTDETAAGMHHGIDTLGDEWEN